MICALFRSSNPIETPRFAAWEIAARSSRRFATPALVLGICAHAALATQICVAKASCCTDRQPA